MSNMINKCNHINLIAGKTPSTEIDWTAARNQYDMQMSELKEMKKAIDARDEQGYRDGIADALMTALGHGSVNPIPLEDDFELMSDCLLTRFDTSFEGAEKTIQKYVELGLSKQDIAIFPSQVNGTDYYVVKTLRACQDNNGEKYAPNKFLKSYLFKEPVYPSVSEVSKI
jgi:hypothetical protein